jgi:hypothetical protein
MQTGVSVNGTLSTEKAIQGNYFAAGGQAIYTDRPTITYVPLTGEKFLRGLITPIDPKNIFFMLQAGYPADFILGLTIEGMNGVRNRSTAGGTAREADPEFFRALQLLREVQAAGAVGMRVEEDKAKEQTSSGVTTCPPTFWRRRRKSGGCSNCRRISRNSCLPIRRCAARPMSWP